MATGDKIREARRRLAESDFVIPEWLLAAGLSAWLALGLVIALGLVLWFLAYTSEISVPLLFAIVVGIVTYPLSGWLTARGVPKGVAAALTVLLLGAVFAGVLWVTVAGVVSQWPNIDAHVREAALSASGQLRGLGFGPPETAKAVRAAATSVEAEARSGKLFTGLVPSIGSGLASGASGAYRLLFEIFIAGTLLFYVLTDYPEAVDFLSRHLGSLPPEVGAGIIDDVVSSFRDNIRGTTITGIVASVVIGIAMVVLRVPLAGTVAVVTFITCYVPFFGAIIATSLAVLVALGSNGIPTALVLLVVVLIVRNVVDTFVYNHVVGQSLNLRPLVVLVVTILGGVLGGLLGAAMATPLTAMCVRVGKRISASTHS